MPAVDQARHSICPRTSRLVWAAVAVLLAAYMTMAMTASLGNGVSYDEGQQLAVGYDIWLRNDFRMESANGDLVKRWATLPFLISRPAFPGVSDPYWRAGGPYEVGYEFFFGCGNHPETLLLQGRAMAVLLGVALGLLVFFCSRGLFGDPGGLLSLSLFVFCPHMLAFGGIVSTEMSICLTLLGSTWCIWRLLHRITWGRLLGSLGFFGLLVLAKPAAVAVFPITAILIAVKLWRGQPLPWHLGKSRMIHARSVQAAVFGGLVAVHGLVGWGTLWAHYGFRYAASPNPTDPGITFRREVPYDINPTVAAFLAWSNRTHFLPQGYLREIKRLVGQNDTQPAFMNGQWTVGGWRTFFPYAMWAKTPPAVLLLLAVAFAGWIILWRAGRKAPTGRLVGPAFASAFYEAVPFACLVIVYSGIAVMQNLDIGFRHILPVYPAVYVLMGALAAVWSTRKKWIMTGIMLLLGWFVFESVSIYPHYLAYFSPVVGGPAQGYKRLVDSSLDWGMDLPGLRDWFDAHNADGREPFFFSYFGIGDPDYYGIKSHRLPGWPEWRKPENYTLTPGIYAISATMLQSVYTPACGPWNKIYEATYQRCAHNLLTFQMTANDAVKRAALLAEHPQAFWDHEYSTFEILRMSRLCAWLRHRRPPDDNVGYSILIWRLNADDLRDACSGPPAELEEKPLQLRIP